MKTEQYFIHGDCRTLDARTLGATVLGTDPPYSDTVHDRMTSGAKNGSKSNAKGVRHRDAGFVSLTDDLRAFIVDTAKTVTRWTLVHTDDRGLGAWIEGLRTIARKKTRDGMIRTVPWICPPDGVAETDGDHVGTYTWIRWSSPQQSGDRPPTGCEFIALGHAPGRMRWGGPGNLTHLEHKCERSWGPKARAAGVDKMTTAKPLDQALDLVAWHSDPGDLWLDLCGGRGTYGTACALLGRDYVGYELDAREAELGRLRIANARNGKLDARDRERYGRWAIPLDSVRAAFGPLAFYGARFVKGRPA